jgi:hypothetical protein
MIKVLEASDQNRGRVRVPSFLIDFDEQGRPRVGRTVEAASIRSARPVDVAAVSGWCIGLGG